MRVWWEYRQGEMVGEPGCYRLYAYIFNKIFLRRADKLRMKQFVDDMEAYELPTSN